MTKHLFQRSLVAVALAGVAFVSQAANVARIGNLVYNTDVVRIDFSVGVPSAVTLWTDSWQAGLNFDPTLALFDAGFSLVTIGDDTADPAALLPGQGGFDSQIHFHALAPGDYHLALSASGNDALGPFLSSGFSLTGTTPILISDWNQPSYDINANDQKGSFWQVHLDGVGSVVAPVPEPSEIVLMLTGLVFMGGALRRHKTSAAATKAPLTA